MKKELLAPAGNFECLKSAVQNGADAVYLGGKKFGARAFASNFDDKEMLEAISYCHLYGVRIYVTVNTMIYESELKEALNYVGFLYENHVDAIIMADLGLMKLSLEKYPDLEIHASTQAHTHNLSQAKFLKKLGVKRVVVARELSLNEIETITNEIEVETFIHGALCISYSGQCLFSSLLLHRSGNRGECAQVCRLPYELYENDQKVETDGNYLLSAKDLNTSTNFKKLMESNIHSFKIEGRMKSPSYVAFITKMYRRLMDDYELKQDAEVTIEEQKKAQVLFSRGFTEGKLFSKSDDDFINQKTNNHQGIKIGEIIEVTPRKIKIKLSENLYQEDGVKFASEDKGMMINYLFNIEGKLIHSGKKGETVFLDNRPNLRKLGDVLKTIDHRLEKSLETKETRKVPVTMNVNISSETGIKVNLSDSFYEVSVTRPWVYKALKIPTSEESVSRQLKRFGDTIFELMNLEITMEKDVFINIGNLNEIRRFATEALMKKRTECGNVRIFEVQDKVTDFAKSHTKIFASVQTEEQLKSLLECNIDGIYVSDYDLYEKYMDESVIYRENRVRITNKKKDASAVLLGETGSILNYPHVKKYGDSYLNIANHGTVELLLKEKVERMTLSVEMEISDLEPLLKKYPFGNPFEWIIYGRPEIMVLKHCILKENVNQDKICKVCKRDSNFYLKDRNNAMYPLETDEQHLTHIYYHRPVNLLAKTKEYLEVGLRNFRLDFYDESAEEIVKLVNHLKNELHIDLQ